MTDCSAHGTRRRAWGPRFESLFEPLAALFHGSNQPQSSASTVGVDNQFKLNLITCLGIFEGNLCALSWQLF